MAKDADQYVERDSFIRQIMKIQLQTSKPQAPETREKNLFPEYEGNCVQIHPWWNPAVFCGEETLDKGREINVFNASIYFSQTFMQNL